MLSLDLLREKFGVRVLSKLTSEPFIFAPDPETQKKVIEYTTGWYAWVNKYSVFISRDGYATCTCPHFGTRKKLCKHILIATTVLLKEYDGIDAGEFVGKLQPLDFRVKR